MATEAEARAGFERALELLSGGGGEQILGQAWRELETSAEAGFAPAWLLSGDMCLNGHGGGEVGQPDEDEAIRRITRAAEAGLGDAAYRLGEIYLSSVGKVANAETGRHWLERAAAERVAPAAVSLAYVLERGIGGARRPDQAIEWLYRAARVHPGAAFALALRYERGHMVEASPPQAAHWYRQAAGASYPTAAEALAALDVEPATEAVPLAVAGSADRPYPEARLKVLSWRPRAFRIHDLLDPEECAHLMDLARPLLRRAAVLSSATGEITHSAGRSNTEATLPATLRDVVVASTERRMAEWSRLPPENGEPYVLIHYNTGEEYRPHFDWYDPDNALQAAKFSNGGQRVATIFSYLCDVEEGGSTDFPEVGLSVPPRKGDGLMFFNMLPDGTPDKLTLHAGTPVRRGEKWLATKWFRQGRYTPPVAAGSEAP
jgi:prolyl 4-hydroxylase